MNIISVEGMPVAFMNLSKNDLDDLQKHYLPIMFNVDEDDIYRGFSRISKSDRQLDDPTSDLFLKYNETLKPYIMDYVQSYNFDFNYELNMHTWYNVHAKHDHHSLHSYYQSSMPMHLSKYHQ